MALFDGCRLKLTRAREHLDDLNRRIQLFYSEEPDPQTVFWDQSREPDEYVVRARIRKSPDAILGLITGEASHHLRSALDHAIGELIEVTTGAPPPSSHNFGFPIFAERGEDTDGKLKRMTRGVSPLTFAFIERIQPYQYKEPKRHILWVLHRMDIENKHRSLHVLLGAAGIRRITHTGSGGASAFSVPERWVNNPVSFPLEDGTEVCSFSSRDPSHPGVNVELDLFIGLAAPSEAFGVPIQAILDAATKNVEELLTALMATVA